MDFDDMLKDIGEFGKFQIITFLLICFPVMLSAANNISYVFTAGIPNYRCFIPECEELDSEYTQPWLQSAIPNAKNSQTSDYVATQCTRFVTNLNASFAASCENIFSKEIEICKEWIFDNNEKTIVNNWNITCLDNQWKLSLVGTLHFVGYLVGAAVFGILADRFGRKPILIFCTILMSVAGILQAFSTNYVMFVIFKFINAAGVSFIYPLAFIIGVEIVGPGKRELTGTAFNYFFSVGEALLALIAWLTKDWFWLQICISTPGILVFTYYWFVPESVRWLLAKRKYDEAKSIVCKAAEVNKVTLSKNVLNCFAPNSEEVLKIKLTEKNIKILPVFMEMIRSSKLVIRHLIIFLLWIMIVFVFYGLSSNSTSIGGDKYLNFALVSLIEIPGYMFSWFTMKTYGRRLTLIGSLLGCGITCTVNIFIPSNKRWAVIVLYLIGKMNVTAAFGTIYVYTSEVFPTVVRSAGVGVSSTLARIGASIAPFVPLLGAYVSSLPNILFGGVAITAGLLAIKLPETLGTRLPETVEDSKRLK